MGHTEPAKGNASLKKGQLQLPNLLTLQAVFHAYFILPY